MLLLTTATIGASSSLAQTTKPYLYDVSRYTIKEGLPDSTIYTIQKDDKGFLWIGTPNGIARYDGHRFEIFRNEENQVLSLVSENAGNIFIDNQQRIWIGSWGEGLYLYDRNLNLLHHFTHATDNEKSICSDFVQLIYQDSDGDIWVGTNGGGLSLYQDELAGFRHFKAGSEPDSLSHDRVWDVVEGKKAQIWVATGAGLEIGRASCRERVYAPV